MRVSAITAACDVSDCFQPECDDDSHVAGHGHALVRAHDYEDERLGVLFSPRNVRSAVERRVQHRGVWPDVATVGVELNQVADQETLTKRR